MEKQILLIILTLHEMSKDITHNSPIVLKLCTRKI